MITNITKLRYARERERDATVSRGNKSIANNLVNRTGK
jgi:hypothetical protein